MSIEEWMEQWGPRDADGKVLPPIVEHRNRYSNGGRDDADESLSYARPLFYGAGSEEDLKWLFAKCDRAGPLS
jgi:hypothetical protein